MAPMIIPITVPTIPITRAIVESFSFLFLAMIAKTIAIGPKTIGRNNKESAPSTIAIIENVFPVDCVLGSIDIKTPFRGVTYFYILKDKMHEVTCLMRVSQYLVVMTGYSIGVR